MTTVRDDRPQQRFVLEKDGAVGELAYEVEGVRHRAVLVIALRHSGDSSRTSSKMEVLTCKMQVSVVRSLFRLT